MSAIYKRELASYFRSPIGWVAIAIFALMGGFFFAIYMQNSSSVNISDELNFLRYVFFVVIPLITMRLFSEEKKNGTEVLLYTAPVPLYKVVLGKYFAALSLLLIMVSSTLIHVVLVVIMGGLVDTGTLGSYIGFVFLAAVFISIGVLCSAVTENQIIAAVISFVVIFFSTILSMIASTVQSAFVSIVTTLNFLKLSTSSINKAGEAVANGINWLDPSVRTDTFTQGIFSISPLLFCLSLVILFLFLTYRILEKRRWSQS